MRLIEEIRKTIDRQIRDRLHDLEGLRDLGHANAYPVAYFVLIDEVERQRHSIALSDQTIAELVVAKDEFERRGARAEAHARELLEARDSAQAHFEQEERHHIETKGYRAHAEALLAEAERTIAGMLSAIEAANMLLACRKDPDALLSEQSWAKEMERRLDALSALDKPAAANPG